MKSNQYTKILISSARCAAVSIVFLLTIALQPARAQTAQSSNAAIAAQSHQSGKLFAQLAMPSSPTAMPSSPTAMPSSPTAMPSSPVTASTGIAASSLSGDNDVTIIKDHLLSLSKTAESASCTFLDSSSCSNCRDPVAFSFCVKDGTELLESVESSKAMVLPGDRAEGMRRQSATMLANFTFDPNSARTAAASLRNSLLINGFPGILSKLSDSMKSSLMRGISLIQENGRLPIPSGPARPSVQP